eukprot:scaffold287169_cov21-Prasinocladus_malaysianus.AAC.1
MCSVLALEPFIGNFSTVSPYGTCTGTPGRKCKQGASTGVQVCKPPGASVSRSLLSTNSYP